MINQTNKKMFSRETLYFCIVIALTLGIILGYAWRMTQIDEYKTKKVAMEALEECIQLLADEMACKQLKK